MAKRSLKGGKWSLNTNAVLIVNIQKGFHKISIVNMAERKLDAVRIE
jgi:hypothetical protein